MVLWGAQFPLMHDLATRWDPYTISLIRYPVAALLLIALDSVLRRGVPAAALVIPLWRKLALGTSIAAFAVCFTLGIATGNPITTAIIAATGPVTAGFVAWLVVGEKPRRGLLLALILVVPGAALTSVDLDTASAKQASLAGAGLILLGQIFWSWYSLMAQKWLKGWRQAAITGHSLLWACPLLLLVYGVAKAAGATYAQIAVSPLLDLGLFAVLTLGALVAGVLLWNVSVARLGLAFSSLHLNLIPVVGMAIATALGVLPRWEQVLGTVLVIIGVLLAQTLGVRRARKGML